MKKNQLFYFISFIFIFGIISGFFVYQVEAVAPYVSINYNNYETRTRKVQLTLQGPEDVRMMIIANNIDFSDGRWEPFQAQKTWYLDFGAGAKTVYVKFEDRRHYTTDIYKDTIQLTVPVNMDVDFIIDNNLKETNSRYVSLKFVYSGGVEGFITSNDNNFVGIEYQNMMDSLMWVVTPGDGVKTIYVQFIDADKKTKTISKTITYKQLGVGIPEGSLIKGQTDAVYYYGYDGELHPFLNSLIYHSWFKNFSNIRYVSSAKLAQYKLGNPVCVRPGSWLVKFKGLPKVYAVGPGCVLQPILSNAEAYLLYGQNWQKRVIELDTIAEDGYIALTYDATDADNKIIDRDRDGVSTEGEKDYGTSDSNSDSDEDGLTDFEEIYYWFTDPTLADTDGDKHRDGVEVATGYNPIGYGKLEQVPDKSYEYPTGSIIKSRGDGKLYYHHSNGKYYYVGNNSDDNLFKSNNLSANFIIESPVKINFSAERGALSNNEMETIYPTQFIGNGLFKM